MSISERPTGPVPTLESSSDASTHKNPIWMGVTSLVVSLVGIFFFVLPVMGLVFPAVAIVFGILGIVKQNGRGLAIAGLAIGTIEVILSIAILFNVTWT